MHWEICGCLETLLASLLCEILLHCLAFSPFAEGRCPLSGWSELQTIGILRHSSDHQLRRAVSERLDNSLESWGSLICCDRTCHCNFLVWVLISASCLQSVNSMLRNLCVGMMSSRVPADIAGVDACHFESVSHITLFLDFNTLQHHSCLQIVMPCIRLKLNGNEACSSTRLHQPSCLWQPKVWKLPHNTVIKCTTI